MFTDDESNRFLPIRVFALEILNFEVENTSKEEKRLKKQSDIEWTQSNQPSKLFNSNYNFLNELMRTNQLTRCDVETFLRNSPRPLRQMVVYLFFVITHESLLILPMFQ